jgi:hypothetical protein
MVDRWIINQAAPAAQVDASLATRMFSDLLQSSCFVGADSTAFANAWGELSQTDPTAAAQLELDIAGWMGEADNTLY